jgi:hypothetical protein
MGHFLTIKMVVTKKYEFSWPKGMCSPVRICTGVNKMSGSKKVIVGLKSTPDSPKSPAKIITTPIVEFGFYCT